MPVCQRFQNKSMRKNYLIDYLINALHMISLWTPSNIPYLSNKLHRELNNANQIIEKLAENIY